MIPTRETVLLCGFGLAFCATGCEASGPCSGLDLDTQTIASDTTWQCTTAPYVIDGDIVVGGGATLTIAPGVTVRAAEGSAIVVGDEAGGAIVADGTEAPITFTSTADVGAPGQWGGIIVGANATQAVFRGVTIEYAGDAERAEEVVGRAALRVASGAELVDSTIRASAGHGVEFTEEGHATAFSGNEFAENRYESVSVYGNHLGSLSGPNRFDAGDRVLVEGDVVDTSAVWSNLGTRYHVVGTLMVEGESEPAEITIDDNANFEFASGASLVVGHDGPGGITARGGETSRIVFTSDQEVPAPGDWPGVVLDTQTTTALFDLVEFRFAGEEQRRASVSGKAALTVLGGAPTIRQSGFFDSDGNGLFVAADGLVGIFEDNEFSGNAESAIRTSPNAVGSLAASDSLGAVEHLWIDGGVIENSATWSPIGIPYWIQDDVFVGGANAPELTLAPGVVVLMGPGTSFVVGRDAPATFVAKGTLKDPIVFTSSAYPQAPGDWGGLILDEDSTAELDRMRLSYCGDSTMAGSRPVEACLGITGTQAKVTNCHFEFSSLHGIELERGGTLFDPFGLSNTFDEIPGLAFYQDPGY